MTYLHKKLGNERDKEMGKPWKYLSEIELGRNGSKYKTEYFKHLQFSAGIWLIAESSDKLQEILCESNRKNVNRNKTKLSNILKKNMNIEDEELKEVQEYIYLSES